MFNSTKITDTLTIIGDIISLGANSTSESQAFTHTGAEGKTYKQRNEKRRTIRENDNVYYKMYCAAITQTYL